MKSILRRKKIYERNKKQCRLKIILIEFTELTNTECSRTKRLRVITNVEFTWCTCLQLLTTT